MIIDLTNYQFGQYGGIPTNTVLNVPQSQALSVTIISDGNIMYTVNLLRGYTITLSNSKKTEIASNFKLIPYFAKYDAENYSSIVCAKLNNLDVFDTIIISFDGNNSPNTFADGFILVSTLPNAF